MNSKELFEATFKSLVAQELEFKIQIVSHSGRGNITLEIHNIDTVPCVEFVVTRYRQFQEEKAEFSRLEPALRYFYGVP